MFKRTGTILYHHLRRLHTHPTSPYIFRAGRKNGYALAAGAVVAGSVLMYANSHPVHNDAPSIPPAEVVKSQTKPSLVGKPSDPDALYTLVWGSNNERTLIPKLSREQVLRTPTVAQWLDGVALRDLQLHENYGACIDARGDVYQWGDGFFGSVLSGVDKPRVTLKNKNIVQLQLTENKLYALSSSGKVYTLAANAMQQELLPGSPTSASDSCWGTGWLWGEDCTVDFAEVTPAEALSWRESIVKIAAGENHLLALTTAGRVFAHPVNKKANYHGQLGFRKFSVPDHAASVTKRDTRLEVELIPKSLADPYLKASDAVRVTSSAYVSDNLSNLDDTNIRFCPDLFEIPALKGTQAEEIAAGGRSSFIRTPDGRVLGWGANEHGQIGLGANVALDTITVPTEVILWRFVKNNVKSKCLHVTAGGDLTAFMVEREHGQGPKTTDLLLCGNGQYGGLGNNAYTNVQGNPSRVKAVSGLLQYNDHTHELEAIKFDEISISPTGHVLLSLISNPEGSEGVGGRDLMVWGRNHESELGNGKKSNLVIPTPVQSPDNSERLMLQSKKAKYVQDLHGHVWKRGVKVKQQVASGYGNSVVYWKIAS